MAIKRTRIGKFIRKVGRPLLVGIIMVGGFVWLRGIIGNYLYQRGGDNASSELQNNQPLNIMGVSDENLSANSNYWLSGLHTLSNAQIWVLADDSTGKSTRVGTVNPNKPRELDAKYILPQAVNKVKVYQDKYVIYSIQDEERGNFSLIGNSGEQNQTLHSLSAGQIYLDFALLADGKVLVVYAVSSGRINLVQLNARGEQLELYSYIAGEFQIKKAGDVSLDFQDESGCYELIYSNKQTKKIDCRKYQLDSSTLYGTKALWVKNDILHELAAAEIELFKWGKLGKSHIFLESQALGRELKIYLIPSQSPNNKVSNPVFIYSDIPGSNIVDASLLVTGNQTKAILVTDSSTDNLYISNTKAQIFPVPSSQPTTQSGSPATSTTETFIPSWEQLEFKDCSGCSYQLISTN